MDHGRNGDDFDKRRLSLHCRDVSTVGLVTAAPARRAGPFAIREVAYGPCLRQPRHVHAEMGVTLVVRGAIRETACAQEEIATSLSVVVKPAGVEHADEVGPRGACTLQILFDPAAARPLLGEAPGLDRWSWLHARTCAAEMLSLLRYLRGTRAVRPDELEDRVVDVLGAAVELPVARGEPPRWLARVREALDDSQPGVRVADLAREAGTHAVSVSRAFRRHFGCSITEYRRRQRVRRAAATIESSPESLSQVAHAAGFADHAHLCREFRDATGLTPSEFRGLASGSHRAG